MAAAEHEPAPPDGADERGDRDRDRRESDGADGRERDGAYERAQPKSQPTVSSEPEPDDDPANAG